MNCNESQSANKLIGIFYFLGWLLHVWYSRCEWLNCIKLYLAFGIYSVKKRLDTIKLNGKAIKY